MFGPFAFVSETHQGLDCLRQHRGASVTSTSCRHFFQEPSTGSTRVAGSGERIQKPRGRNQINDSNACALRAGARHDWLYQLADSGITHGRIIILPHDTASLGAFLKKDGAQRAFAESNVAVLEVFLVVAIHHAICLNDSCHILNVSILRWFEIRVLVVDLSLSPFTALWLGDSCLTQNTTGGEEAGKGKGQEAS